MYYLLKAISIPARSLLRISPSPQVYNQQLSVSQMHKQSFVLLHWFFQVSEKEKKIDPQEEILSWSVFDFFPPTQCRVNTTTQAGAALRCAPELLTIQSL